MGVISYWDNPEKTILVYQFEGEWTWDDFYTVFEQVKAAIAPLPHVVNFICHYPTSYLYIPPNILSQIRRIHQDTPANIGVTVVVGGSTAAATIYNIIKRIYPAIAERYFLVGTMEQARALLQARQSCISGLG
jgi:hypothetical protein